MNNFCNNEIWTVEDLIDSYQEKPNKKKKIQVYKRQRNLVWTSEQKEKLIISIKKGLPIGALLLYKHKEDTNSNLTTYLVVDGLQRSTALLDYYKNPNKYVDKSILEDDVNIQGLLDKINEHLTDKIDDEYIKQTICEYIKHVTGFEETLGFSSSKGSKYILDKLNVKNYELKEEVEEILQPILKKIKDSSEIGKAQIPVIIYNGDFDNLPDIFYNINKEGTQLSKYEVYSALWSKQEYLIKIDNTQIIDYIKKRYTKLEDIGLEVQDFDESADDFNTQQFSVFEYIFGLGKYISKEYSIFKQSDDSEVDSIIFNLCTLCLLEDISKMQDLADKMSSIDINKFEVALIDAIKVVNLVLKPYIDLKLNRKKKSNNTSTPIYHKDFQIVSIIASVFKEKYDDSYELRDTWKDNNPILKNIEQYYLYDILRNYFSASGDSKAKKCVEGKRYTKALTKKDWDTVIDYWFNNDHMMRREKKRVTIKDVDILFMKYLYSKILTSYDENSLNDFEIEHIISVDNLKNKAEELDSGLPISCIANLGLLKKDINNAKKEKDIYEYFDGLVADKKYTKDQAEKILSECEGKLIINKDMLDDFKKESEVDYIKSYNEFLSKRFKKIKEIFYEKQEIR